MTRLCLLTLLWLVPPGAWSAVPVTRAPLGTLLTERQHSAPATVQPLNHSHLSAEISGLITAIPVRIGDRVVKGAALARLDCRMPHARLAAAIASRKALVAQRRLAQNQLRRAHNLSSGRTIPAEEVDRRESETANLSAQIEAQDAAIRQARLGVERCTIAAPFAGVVVARPAGVGSLAVPGTPLVEMVQTDDAEVSARLRGPETATLATAAGLRFHYAGRDYPLRLRALLPVVDEQNRTREARLLFVKDAAPPGAAGRLLWNDPDKVLPADLLVRRTGRSGIFLFDKGHARFHPLPGAVEGRPARVNLPPETVVIVEGRHRLRDGDEVSVTQTAD